MLEFLVDFIIWTAFMLVIIILFMVAVSKNRLRVFYILLTVYGVGISILYIIDKNNYERECTPNVQDVAVMKPQAKVISDYILKHSIPESLAMIPDLVYPLERCEQKDEYLDEDHKLAVKRIAHRVIVEEICSFMTNNKKYEVKIFFSPVQQELKLHSPETSTWIAYSFQYTEDKNGFKLTKTPNDNPHIYDNKTDGICTPFRP